MGYNTKEKVMFAIVMILFIAFLIMIAMTSIDYNQKCEKLCDDKGMIWLSQEYSKCSCSDNGEVRIYNTDRW